MPDRASGAADGRRCGGYLSRWVFLRWGHQTPDQGAQDAGPGGTRPPVASPHHPARTRERPATVRALVWWLIGNDAEHLAPPRQPLPRATTAAPERLTTQAPHRCALPCIKLFPVFPVGLRLFPVRPGTEKPNDDNGLHAFCWFVPGVPGKSGRHPEGKRAKVLPRLA